MKKSILISRAILAIAVTSALQIPAALADGPSKKNDLRKEIASIILNDFQSDEKTVSKLDALAETDPRFAIYVQQHSWEVGSLTGKETFRDRSETLRHLIAAYHLNPNARETRFSAPEKNRTLLMSLIQSPNSTDLVAVLIQNGARVNDYQCSTRPQTAANFESDGILEKISSEPVKSEKDIEREYGKNVCKQDDPVTRRLANL